MDRYKNWHIFYNNDYQLDFHDIYPYLKICNNNISFDDVLFKDYLTSELNQNLSSFNSIGSERNFITNNGSCIKVSGGTYGDIVDINSEVDYILNSLRNFHSETNRFPLYTFDLPDDIKSMLDTASGVEY